MRDGGGGGGGGGGTERKVCVGQRGGQREKCVGVMVGEGGGGRCGSRIFTFGHGIMTPIITVDNMAVTAVKALLMQEQGDY